MKFEKFELKKSSMSLVKGGTSTTSFIECGVLEMEYHDADGDGELSEEEMEDYILIELTRCAL